MARAPGQPGALRLAHVDFLAAYAIDARGVGTAEGAAYAEVAGEVVPATCMRPLFIPACPDRARPCMCPPVA